MKRTQMLIPLVLLLALASTVTPALGAQGKTEKINYTLLGSISDSRDGRLGTMSLTISGSIVGAPDYQGQSYTETPGGYSSWSYFVDYTDFNATGWPLTMVEVQQIYEETWIDVYVTDTTSWYGQQPAYNGKLVVNWGDSIETFRVGLSPIRIDMNSIEHTISNHQYTVTITNTTSIWDDNAWGPGQGGYVYYDQETWINGPYPLPSTTEHLSQLIIILSCKAKSKGSPPIEGVFSISDTRYTKGGSIFGGGILGPYYLNVQMSWYA